MFTLANIFTALRILLAPVFFFFVIKNDPFSTRMAVVMFGFAALTDYFDGWLARKFGDVSELGIFLDPLADKVLVLSAFLSFVYLEIIPVWTVIVIVLRDAGTTLMRVYADAIKLKVETSRSAKWKTFLQMLFVFYILILMALYRSPEFPAVTEWAAGVLFSSISTTIMLIIVFFTVWTFIEYVLDNKQLFKRMFSTSRSENL